MLCLQLEVGNLDFLDTHQLRQRLSENASKVRSRVQQVYKNVPPRLCYMQGHEHIPNLCCIMHAFTLAERPDQQAAPHACWHHIIQPVSYEPHNIHRCLRMK